MRDNSWGGHGVVSGLIGPSATDENRSRRYGTICRAAGIFKGHLYFYKVDGDIRARPHEIDTARCPVHLLTDEYGYNCPPRTRWRRRQSRRRR
jgi:hypothetical protein